MVAKKLSDDAFDSVPLYRLPDMLLCDNQPEPVVFKIVVGGQQQQIFVGGFRVYLIKNTPVGAGFKQAVFFSE
jgi:hypothetical protein